MAYMYSNFQRPRAKAPAARKPMQKVILDYSGLDVANPYDLVQEGHSPFAKNFRIYDTNSEARSVQITTRKGSGLYTNVLGETLDGSDTSVTGAGLTYVDTLLNWRAVKYTATSTGRLTKLEINMKRNTGFAPLIVEMYDEDWNLMADSSVIESIVPDNLTYTPVYFIEAPRVEASTDYYFVFYVQDDGSGAYQLSTNDSGTALASNSGVAGMTPVSYGINYKSYVAPEMVEKGMFRFNMEGGTNKTMVVYSNGTNDVLYAVDDNDGTFDVVDNTLDKDAVEYSFAVMDGKLFYVNGFDNLKAWNGTSVETITDPELSILKLIVVYKDRLWGVLASESNKIIFSEVPGNPSDTTPDKQWYYAWRSVSFMYQPAPKVADPIMALVPYQDVLKVITTGQKIDIYGYSYDTFYSKQNPDTKGALSSSTATDGEFLYHVGKEGIIRHNGTSGVIITTAIQPIYDSIPDKSKINIAYWNNTIRMYYGSGYSNEILVYDILRNEWMRDTETWVKRGVVWEDADDNNQLIESSSLVPRIMFAETGFSALGKAIDFAYWTKYESLGVPAQKKRIIKFFPLFEPSDRDFNINVDMDKDMQNLPTRSRVGLTTTGARWGEFNWDDGTTWGANTAFVPTRLRFPGYAHYFQARISRRAVNNQVKFYGTQYSYKLKRL